MGRGWVHVHRIAASNKKGKLFTKLSKEISVAARLGGADPEGNARLRSALKDAQKCSMPKDTVERAIKRGSGQLEGTEYEEITYEGYGPHNVAVIVETLTDNKNRTAQDIRSLFTKYGQGLGALGSLSWMFKRVGSIVAKHNQDIDPEVTAIEAGAQDIEDFNDNEWHFITEVNDFGQVLQYLEKQKWDVSEAKLNYLPKNNTELTDEQMNEVQEFLTKLMDNDDVKNIYPSI